MVIEDKNVFVRIEKDEAIESRKLLLESIESSLNMLLISENFSSLCSNESKEISQLKAKTSEIVAEIDMLMGNLPKEKKGEIEEKAAEKGKPVKKSPSREELREKELREIREKLKRIT